jgi:tRNA modification GTPase
VRIAILGPPNAGKSSLLNVLAGHEAAIVSPLAGTTRDVVQVQLELGGVKVGRGGVGCQALPGRCAACACRPCMPASPRIAQADPAPAHPAPPCPPPRQVILTDSAGLRQTECPIEAEGVRRAVAAAQQAHIILHVSDADSEAAAVQAGDEGGPVVPLSEHAAHLRVLNKADLLPGSAAAAAAADAAGGTAAAAAVGLAPAAGGGEQGPALSLPEQPLLISCKSGQGVEALVAALQRTVLALVERGGGDGGLGGALVTRARHRCGGGVGVPGGEHLGDAKHASLEQMAGPNLGSLTTPRHSPHLPSPVQASSGRGCGGHGALRSGGARN